MLAASTESLWPADVDSVVLFTNSISFDAHALQVRAQVWECASAAALTPCWPWQVMPTLMLGATLVIAKAGGHMDPSYIAGLIVRHQATSMVFTVPTLVRHPQLLPADANRF